jgi:iron complex transport system substrate-binding protein
MKKINLRFISLLIAVAAIYLIACQEAHLNPPSDPQRIVSLKPNLTEILFALGAGERVVGVTRHCVWPKEASKLPKVGDYAFPDLERIISLQPDLVVTNKESSTPRFISVIEEAKIPVLVLETRTLSQIYRTIEQLGATLKIPEKGLALVSEIRDSLELIHEQSRKYRSKSVLLVIQRHPLMVAGTKSFINEVLKAAGARNVVPFSRTAYPQISMEEVLAWQPEVILDLDPTSQLSGWTDYKSLPAVKNGQIYFLSPNLFLPGPRIARTTEMIANALYFDKANQE